MARNLLQQHLENQACDWVQVAGKRLAAHAQRLQRNRPASREGVNYERRRLSVSGFNQRAGHSKKGFLVR